MITVTRKSKLCCLISPSNKCFDCKIQLCVRHYNYYSKKSGPFKGCTDYGKGDDQRPYGYCLNEICSPCSKKQRVLIGHVKCKLHAPDFSISAPKVFRCPDSSKYGLYTQIPLEEFRKHFDTCKSPLDNHYVGIKDVYGLHRRALKTDL